MKSKESTNQEDVSLDLLEGSGLSDVEIRYWNNLQRSFSGEDFVVIEYDPSFDENQIWRCFVGQEKKGVNLKLWGKKQNQLYSELNDKLKKCFGDVSFTPNSSFWNDIQRILDWRGFFMPVKDIKALKIKRLEKHLTFLQLKKDYFPYVSFLRELKNASQNVAFSKIPFPVLTLWEYYRFYVEFLIQCKTEEEETFKTVQILFEEHVPSLDFQNLLPSEQLQDLLFIFCERFYLRKSYHSTLNKLLEKATPSVQAFFEKHEKNLASYVEKGFHTSSSVELDLNTIQDEIRTDFFNICLEDNKIVTIQELIDDQSQSNFIQAFPIALKDRFGKERKLSLKDKIKTVLGEGSIIDRIKAVGDQIKEKPEPAFAPILSPFLEDHDQKWYNLDVDQKMELLDAVEEFLSEEEKQTLEKIVEQRWLNHLQNQCNKMTAPFFLWESSPFSLFPVLNNLDAERSSQLQEAFWEKREREEEELKDLNERLRELFQLKSSFAIESYLNDFDGFSYSVAQERWRKALDRHRMAIKNQQHFRIRRMREFGILKDDQSVDKNRDIWLDEMLQIEEEVRPYILFVKKAFQAALPVRRTMEFDPYRHSHDGVEFDPMTVQDQDKWMRANVMKTLRRKINKGEVEQINTFCLDSSGSMDHEPMRNLFKILFLLILGLEDRKSYDAIHFFNYYFVETVNFSDKYTNRALLFKILRKISTITKGEVLYGGGGGTNISDGVVQSHDRIKEFVEKIKTDKPDANIVCSIFVITDGEPSMGVINLGELHDLIESKREDGDVEIKGIYIKPEEDESEFIPVIFGENNYVETTEFHDAVTKFVRIMTETYKAQRSAFKWKMKQKIQDEK